MRPSGWVVTDGGPTPAAPAATPPREGIFFGRLLWMESTNNENLRLTITVITDDDLAKNAAIRQPIAAERQQRLRPCTQASIDPKASH